MRPNTLIAAGRSQPPIAGYGSVGEPAGQSGGQQCLATGDDADAIEQLAGVGVLDQEARPANWA
jgi:hypothetical protein